MRMRSFACAAAMAAVPASAQDAGRGIELLPGHPIYHEAEREAGVAMALSITPQLDPATDLIELCQDLRRTAGLDRQNGDARRLETIFVVPYKGMAVEGYYWPESGASGDGVVVPASGIARAKLDAILARAGIPPRVLDEINVEHEISCQTDEPRWHLVWHDIRPVGDAAPTVVIDRAYQRFMAIHQAVVEHSTGDHPFEIRNARPPAAESR